jgi:hypothetical protein
VFYSLKEQLVIIVNLPLEGGKENVTINEFLADMLDEDFPHRQGPWRSFDSFDPPYKRSELRDMARLKIIKLVEKEKKFALTLNATDENGRINA